MNIIPHMYLLSQGHSVLCHCSNPCSMSMREDISSPYWQPPRYVALPVILSCDLFVCTEKPYRPALASILLQQGSMASSCAYNPCANLTCHGVHVQLRRSTFHDFMLDVHSRLHCHERTADPLSFVAAQLMADMRVLCLDEFFVTDVADATMLSRLFGQMWDRGLVLVATSNRCTILPRPDTSCSGHVFPSAVVSGLS